VEKPLVQILVVVANRQARTLSTEVEKGSMRTAFGHGLADPKAKIKSFIFKELKKFIILLFFIIYYFFLLLQEFKKKI
jgi:hypothetical protein